MTTPSRYLISWVKGLLGIMPFTQWIGMTPGDQYEYLAKKTDGTDSVTGMSSQDYQSKADSMSLSSRGALIAIIVFTYYMFRYIVFDQFRLFYWTVKSAVK